MNKSDLATLVREVLEEVMNEGPYKQANKAKKKSMQRQLGRDAIAQFNKDQDAAVEPNAQSDLKHGIETSPYFARKKHQDAADAAKLPTYDPTKSHDDSLKVGDANLRMARQQMNIGKQALGPKATGQLWNKRMRSAGIDTKGKGYVPSGQQRNQQRMIGNNPGGLGPKGPSMASNVPPQIAQAVQSGGKVAFGKYYDANGKYLGKMQQGQWAPATQQENTMPLLRDILVMVENKENRINLMKLTVLMEKMLPELTKPQSTKLTELCAEVHTLAGQLNTLPITIYNHEPWKVLKVAMMAKLMEVKTEVEKLKEDTPHVKQFIKALDEVIIS